MKIRWWNNSSAPSLPTCAVRLTDKFSIMAIDCHVPLLVTKLLIGWNNADNVCFRLLVNIVLIFINKNQYSKQFLP